MTDKIKALILRLKQKTTDNNLRWYNTSDPDGFTCRLNNGTIFIKKLNFISGQNLIGYAIYLMDYNGEVLDKYEIHPETDQNGDKENYFEIQALFNQAKRSSMSMIGIVDEFLKELQ